MLNETWRVWKALQNSKIPIEIPHPLINSLPASAKHVLRIRLTEDGTVTTVEAVSKDEQLYLWRIVKSSDGSFPVVALNEPLLKSSSAKKDTHDDLSSAISSFPHNDAFKQDWPWSDARQKAAIILCKLRHSDKGRDFVELINRFAYATREPGKLLVEISQIGLARIKQGKLDSINEVRELIVGPNKEKSGKQRKMSVLLIFDLDDPSRKVYDKSNKATVAMIFPTNIAKKTKDHRHAATRSAFGSEDVLLNEVFPAVKLPILNKRFPLISMPSDGDKAKCQRRYGLTNYTIFPVTSAESRQISGALEWLLKRPKGTTWRGVSSGKFEKKKELQDLLIVYIEERPELPEKVANLFGSSEEMILAQSEVDTKATCDALDGVVREYPKSKLNLFLVRKASEGQVQVALAKEYQVKNVLAAANRWKASVCNNLPPISIYLPEIRRKEKIFPAMNDAHPLAPFPDQIVRLLSEQWIRDGSKPKGSSGQPQKIVGPSLGDVLSVMLREEGKYEPAAKNMIDLLVRRIGPLLIGVFGAKHAYAGLDSKKKHEPFPRNSRETTLRAVAVLGILLDSLNINKENYMKDATFEIGQVLSLADTLHKDYCIVVRKNQLPNILIGTSLMRRALDNPAGALADLSERMMEYIRWAKVAQVSNEWSENDPKKIAVNEARKKLRQYQPLADDLRGSDLPTECNDVMKAQILLGFLASQPTDDQN